jgi:secreted trypsin-like serine protease
MSFPATKRALLACAAAAGMSLAAMLPAAAPAVQPRIIGGEEAPAGAYPFMVALVMADAADAADGQFCGGQLISDRLVLTAAHCGLAIASSREVDVIAGIDDLGQNDGERMHVTGISIHPGYNPLTNDNDVAVLRLESSTTRGRPIDVAGSADASLFEPGDPVRAIGWGVGYDPQSDRYYKPNQLFQVNVRIVSDADCTQAYGGQFIASSMLCAASPAKDTCYGDSGGPLMAQSEQPSRWVLVGVTSWGEGCAQEGFPGVYARMADLRSFAFGPLVFAPYSVEAPTIKGRPAVGRKLTCGRGSWANDATGFTYEWARRNVTEGWDEPIDGAVGRTYRPTDGDAATPIVCTVTARNAGGYSLAQSAPVEVAGAAA